MSKTRNLSNLVSDGGPFDDGILEVVDITDVTVSAEEINQLVGVTSPIQTQLDNILSETIRTPVITSPTEGQTGVLLQPTIEGSAYAPIYSVDARDFRQFQIDVASGDFSDPVVDEQVDADNFTLTTPLATDTDFKVRIRDVSVTGAESEFSTVVAFKTADISVNEPTLTVEGAPNDVPETPELTTSAFDTTPTGEDTHAATDWEVRKTTDNSLVFSSLNDTVNLLSIVIPAGNLDEDEEYLFRARHIGTTFGAGPFAEVTAKTQETFVDPEDPAFIGAPFAGGFLVGVIDTQQGNIIGADDYQTGLRYALIVSPKSFEGGRDSSPAAGLPTGDLRWDASNRAGQSGSFTRWNGLGSTNSVLAKNDTQYEVYEFIRTLRTAYPVPDDDGSDWYLPAMDELELMYRNLKPTTADNITSSSTRPFPGTQNSGFNPSSDPTGAAYTAGNPTRTSLVDFQSGGVEATDLNFYWSATDANEDNRAWYQVFTVTGSEGFQVAATKNDSALTVRAVRRVVL
jgi:hypothetical protein